ncbi:hypothetical protein QYF36_026371 [Acer negundo]|nr:hypothetical protein QYF36_026371 [Acer negundo]
MLTPHFPPKLIEGKAGDPASSSFACVSYSTSSKTASNSKFARLASVTLDKGKGTLEAPKVPVSKEKEPPAFSKEEVVKALMCICLSVGLSSLFFTPALEVATRGSFFIADVCFPFISRKVVPRRDPSSTHRAYARNVLRKQLAAKEKEMEDRERILATNEEMEAMAATLDPNLIPTDDKVSSKGLSKSDLGITMEYGNMEDKVGEDLKEAAAQDQKVVQDI